MIKGPQLLVIGGGGHACVLLDELQKAEQPVIGILDQNKAKESAIMGFPILGDDKYLETCSVEEVKLINGVGMLPGNSLRVDLFDRLTAKGFDFVSVVSEDSVVSDSAKLHSGVQIMAGAVIQSSVSIGNNAVINTNASVDHHCKLGPNVWVSPGATICGDARIGHDSYIGAGSVILQNVSVPPGTLVPAGAVVKPGDNARSPD